MKTLYEFIKGFAIGCVILAFAYEFFEMWVDVQVVKQFHKEQQACAKAWDEPCTFVAVPLEMVPIIPNSPDQ